MSSTPRMSKCGATNAASTALWNPRGPRPHRVTRVSVLADSDNSIPLNQPSRRDAAERPNKLRMPMFTKETFIRKGLMDLREWRRRTISEKKSPTADAEELIANAAVSPWLLPISLTTYSTWLLAWASELGGCTAPDWVAPTLGAVLGAAFSVAYRVGTVRAWAVPRRPLNIVITGATRGIGFAIAREFIRSGDNVYITSRSPKAVREAIAELQKAEGCTRPQQVCGVDCDVTKPSSVSRLASLAKTHFHNGPIDVWINNAGCAGSFKGFLDAEPQDILQVVQTNLLGALLCTRAALNIMSNQDSGGHIFNMDGAGADGSATPNYAAYGATKSGIAHLMRSIAAECEQSATDVGVHTLSPGMVLTKLLLEGATVENKQAFNILCEQPEVVAAHLVPRIRTVCARNSNMEYIKYLTNQSVLLRFLTAPARLERFFAADGTAKYPNEWERLFGTHSKQTARLQNKERRSRVAPLGFAFASSMTASVFALCMLNASM